MSLSQFIPILGIPIIVKGGAKWYDANRANYFYGVYDTEATLERPPYGTRSVVLTYVSLNAFYNVRPNVNAFVSVNTKVLPSLVVNSPIIDQKTSASMIFGLGYQF